MFCNYEIDSIDDWWDYPDRLDYVYQDILPMFDPIFNTMYVKMKAIGTILECLDNEQCRKECIASFETAPSTSLNRLIARFYVDSTKISNDSEKVIADLVRAEELDPKLGLDASFHYIKKNHLFKLKKYDEAILEIDKCIELQPTLASYYLNKMSVLADMRRFEEALDLVNQILVSFPKSTVICYLARAQLHEELDKINESLTDISKAIELEPTSYEAYFDKARA
jgi:tetratricopeptide (TPR) repeat protein